MKYWLFPTGAIAFALTGCAPNAEQTSPPAQPASAPSAQIEPVELTTEQELAKFCRVCVVDKGEKIEEYFPSRLDTQHNGQTYKFCSDDCKKKFDANSERYILG